MVFLSTPIFGQDLRCRVSSILKWLVFTVIATLGIYLLIYNLYISGIPDFVNDLLISLPDEIRALIYIEKIPDFSNVTFDYAVCMQVLLIIGCGYACYLGCSSFLVNKNNGTLKYIHSLPITRTCVVITRFFAQVTILIIYDILLVFLNIWIASGLNVSSFIFNIPNIFCAMLMGELFFLSLGFAISCIVKFQSTPYTFAFGSLLFCLVMDILYKLFSKEILSDLVLISHYSVYNIIMNNTNISFMTAFTSIIFCLLSVLISSLIYKYKEL